MWLKSPRPKVTQSHTLNWSTFSSNPQNWHTCNQVNFCPWSHFLAYFWAICSVYPCFVLCCELWSKIDLYFSNLSLYKVLKGLKFVESWAAGSLSLFFSFPTAYCWRISCKYGRLVLLWIHNHHHRSWEIIFFPLSKIFTSNFCLLSSPLFAGVNDHQKKVCVLLLLSLKKYEFS